MDLLKSIIVLANVRERHSKHDAHKESERLLRTEGTLSFKVFVFPLRSSHVSVCAGQRGALSTQSVRFEAPQQDLDT